MSSAERRVRRAALSFVARFVVVPSVVACSREAADRPIGRLQSTPALLVAPLAREGPEARDGPPPVLHGTLAVRIERALPAGARVRVWQGYRD